MGSLFSTITQKAQSGARSVGAFYRNNRLLLLSGVTVFSILLIVWARLGFTFQVNQFFAATPSPSVLSVQCSGSTAVLTWTMPGDANSNSLQKFDGTDWKFIFQSTPGGATTYTDTTGTAGASWRHKTGASVASNVVSCDSSAATPPPISGGGTGTASPVTLSVQCGATQNVLTWTAAGTGSTTLSIIRNVDGANGAYVAQGLATTTTTFTDTQVQSGHTYDYAVKNSTTARSNTVHCPTVAVATTPAPTPTATPVPSPVTTPTATPSSCYVGGCSGEICSDQPGAVSACVYYPQQACYRTAKCERQVTNGQCGWTQTPELQSCLAATPTLTPTPVPVITATPVITSTPTPSSPGTVSTGPGDAVVAALLVSGITTLLYVSYTRTSMFRRREVDAIADHKDPMDFRS